MCVPSRLSSVIPCTSKAGSNSEVVPGGGIGVLPLLHEVTQHTKSTSLLDYFRVRKAWEAKEHVASADVVSLKEGQIRYAAREFEELETAVYRNGREEDWTKKTGERLIAL